MHISVTRRYKTNLQQARDQVGVVILRSYDKRRKKSDFKNLRHSIYDTPWFSLQSKLTVASLCVFSTLYGTLRIETYVSTLRYGSLRYVTLREGGKHALVTTW